MIEGEKKIEKQPALLDGFAACHLIEAIDTKNTDKGVIQLRSAAKNEAMICLKQKVVDQLGISAIIRQYVTSSMTFAIENIEDIYLIPRGELYNKEYDQFNVEWFIKPVIPERPVIKRTISSISRKKANLEDEGKYGPQSNINLYVPTAFLDYVENHIQGAEHKKRVEFRKSSRPQADIQESVELSEEEFNNLPLDLSEIPF